jgi:hypothetical protein
LIALLILSFLIPVAIGVLIGFILLPPQKYPIPPMLRLALGGGMGLGITSLAGFLLLPMKGSGYFPLGECLLLVLAIALGFLAFRKGAFTVMFAPPEKERQKSTGLSLCLVTGVIAVSAAASFGLTAFAEPHGKWDAFLIWNMHARFLFRSGADWMAYFGSGLDWTHPDYPLLLPLTVERAWGYCGGETLVAPAVVAAFFACSVAGLLACALGTLRGRDQGCLGAAVLLASPLFVIIGASQLADVPLSYYILGAVTLLFLHDRQAAPDGGALAMAGLFAALAAWTKNEGVLFCALFLSIRPVASVLSADPKRGLKEFLQLAGGASPVLVVLLMFKIAVAPGSDLIAGQSPAGILEKLGDAGRYGTILISYLRTGLTFTQGIPDIRAPFHLNPAIPGIILLSVYIVLAGREGSPGDRRGIITGWALVLLTLVGYFFVLVVTPHDLKWHLLTSLNRLLLQLWPLAIFLVLMSARSPGSDPTGAPAGKRKQAGARSKRAERK